MIPEAPGMMEMPQQPQQPKVNPEVMQIAQMIKSSVNEGNELIDIVKGLMQEEVDQQLIGQALMMGGIEEEDIITIFETASTPPQPSAPEEVDREPQLLARNRDIAKREREQAEQAQSQEQEVDISEQVRTLAKSGIEIKPENEGKFTAWAKKRGMGVQEAARKVLANKAKYPPSVVKMANFARNAAKWKKEEGGEFEPHMMYDTKTGKAYKANKPADHEKYKKLGYLHKDELKKAKDGVDMPAGQYVNGVFIPDESEVDKSMLSQNLQRPANFYMSDNHYAVAPLSPPPETNVLADFISTATGINQDLFSNEVDDYGNRKGALKDVFKRGDGKFLGIKFGEGNPDPDAGSGMSKMEMHKMLKPFYYDTTIDTSKITTPENIKAYTDWAMQQKKEWDSNTQEQLDEQASVVEDVSGQSAQQDNRTFGEWAEDAGHDIVKMSENAVNLLQNLWKKTTGKMQKGGGVNNPGFKALPPEAQHNILSNMATGGDGPSRKDVKEYSKVWGTNKRDTKDIISTLLQNGYNSETDTIISSYHPSMPIENQRHGQRMHNLATNVNSSGLLPFMHSSSPNFAGNLGATYPFVDATGYGSYLAVPEMNEGGEDSYLANRDRVIKRAIARQEGKAQDGLETAEQKFPMGPFQEASPYQTYPYITEIYEDEELLNEDEVIDMDGDKIPDNIDIDGGDGTGEARLGTIGNPSARQLFEKINFEPEVNVSNKVEGTINRLADNPIVGAFSSISDAAVKTARFVNDRFDEKAYRDALDQMEERSGADYKFAVQTSDPMSQGFYDANTGQLQGEAERTAGYYGSFAASPYSFGTAQDGLEMETGGEVVELSQDMIAQLIAAGADIEII